MSLTTLVQTSSRGAVNFPGGSCFDAVYFDGLSTLGDAYHCSTALKKAGYNGGAFSNATAKTALIRLPLDAVFHFSGHSVGALPGGATGLVFESPEPNGIMEVLLGNPAAVALHTGPTTLCSLNGGCRNAILTSYPWANLLAKYNLVVLQSCQTGKEALGRPSIAQFAHLAGAGTVIGFSDNTTSPSSWAGSFFGNIGNGVPYSIAAASAAGACCGYGSWKLLMNPRAPQTLYPRGFYVPPTHVPVPQTTQSVDVDRTGLTAELKRWLDVSRVAPLHWSPIEGLTKYQAYEPGMGLFQMDARTHEVTQAVFERELVAGIGSTLSLNTARRVATEFAQAHFAGFGHLVERKRERVDHGIFEEFRFTWQGRNGEAWLPLKVVVGVNSSTGRVAIYNAQRSEVRVGLEPRISRDEAIHFAFLSLGIPTSHQVRANDLEVVVDQGDNSRLVWVIGIESSPVQTMQVLDYQVFWVDAASGQVSRPSS